MERSLKAHAVCIRSGGYLKFLRCTRFLANARSAFTSVYFDHGQVELALLSLFCVGSPPGRGQVVRLDPGTGASNPFLPQLPAAYLMAFSKDGRSIAYVDYSDGNLWKARSDGSDPVQLTAPPIQADSPFWSPDGKFISFTDLASHKAYLVPADRGEPQELAPGFLYNDTAWSPDGKKIVFGGQRPPVAALYILNLETRKISKVAGSDWMGSPRWSPDGRHLCALSARGLVSFDFATQGWTVLTKVQVEYHTWSTDSRYLYFTSHEGGVWAIYRVGVADRKVERALSLKGIQPAQDAASLDPWFGLAPDGSFLLLTNPGGGEIYSLDFQTPAKVQRFHQHSP